MRLIRIEATDFCLLGHIELVLGAQGLVWVGGINKDSDSATSNGSGKSTLLKAIAWGWYGESIDGKDGDEVIRSGTKCATVKEWFEDGEDEWCVTRTRRKGQPRVALRRVGDEKDWDGSRKDIQAKLDAIMGLDFQAFRNTVLYGQNDHKRFTAPATSDAERKALLHGILRTSILGKCYEWAKAEHLKLKREADGLENEIGELQAKVGEYDIDALEQQQSEWGDKVAARVRTIAQEARALLESAKKVSGKSSDSAQKQQELAEFAEPEVDAAEKVQQRAFAARGEAGEVVTACERTLNEAELACDQVDTELKRLGKDKCPTCTTPLDEGVAAEYITLLRGERNVKQAIYDAAERAVTAAKDQRAASGRVYDHADDVLGKERNKAHQRDELAAEVAALEAEAAKAEGLVQQAKDKAAEAREAQEAPNPYTEQLEAAREKVAGYKRDIKAKRKELGGANTERAHYQFWVRGFSNQGLPSFVLDSVMPYLTDRTNHYLGILADGDITMSFSTQRELKSAKGEMRDEIHIGWEIEGVSEYPPSGGQLKKMEIATDLALMDMVATREGAHPDILMLDEILDGLDKEGRTRVTHLLHELRKTRETILVISHDDSIAESFEKAIILVKADGATNLEVRMAA